MTAPMFFHSCRRLEQQGQALRFLPEFVIIIRKYEVCFVEVRFVSV